MEPFGECHAVLLVVHPLLANGMGDTQHRTAEDLAAQGGWMDDGPDVCDGEEIDDVVHARFDIHLDFSKGRHERQRIPVAGVHVACHAHQALPRKRSGRPLGKRIDLLGHLMAVVDASELDRALGRARERHAGAAALARHALVGHDVVFGPAAEILRGDLLQLRDRIARRGMRSARHRMRRLAAARDAAPRQVLGRVTPRDVDLFPRHAHHFRRHTLAIRPRFGAKIADASLDGHPAVRLDDKESVEAD